MKEHDATERAYNNGYEKGKADGAREIFEEIESLIDLACAMTGLDIIVGGKYVELKKKYTEENK